MVSFGGRNSDSFFGIHGVEDGYFELRDDSPRHDAPASLTSGVTSGGASALIGEDSGEGITLTFGSGRNGFSLSGSGAEYLRSTGADLGAWARMQMGLADLFAEYQGEKALAASRASAAPDPGADDDGSGEEFIFTSANGMMPIVDGRVALDVIAVNGDGAALLAALQGLGLVGGASFNRMVGGWLPIDALDELAAMDAVAFARPAYMMTATGAVVNQADASMGSDVFRTGTGMTGVGLTVGVISDSFDTYDDIGGPVAGINYLQDIISGDLPSNVNVLLDSFLSTTIDEGRAMAQLVHDVAPGASIAFHTANGGQAVFAAGILALAGGSVNADIVVDDIIYFAEPMFQDGVIADAVDQVTAQGVLYFSSAGNQATQSYESVFRNSGVVENIGGFNYTLHDFDPGALTDTRLLVNQAGALTYILQWVDNYGSINGGLAAGDLALIFRTAGGALIGVADVLNFDPVEGASLTFTGNIQISIGSFEDAPLPTSIMKMNWFGAAAIEFPTNSSSSYGHNNAAGAFAVGAAGFEDTPAFGVSPVQLENFSSLGGTQIYFDTDGDLLPAPIDRDSVDFTAPDGGNTTFFFSDGVQDADSLPNFFGTSAAAPNAAAAVALLLQKYPTATRGQIELALESTAIDIQIDENGNVLAAGYDRRSGAGLIQIGAADAFLAALLNGGNTAPQVNATDAGTAYIEVAGPNSPLGTPVNVYGSISITDPADTILSATVAITNNFVFGDQLAVTAQPGLTAIYNAATGVLTITGAGTPAAYQATLSSLTFANAGDNPTFFGSEGDRTISLTVFDGQTSSATFQVIQNITAVNDAPVNTNTGADSANEDQVNVPILGLSTADADSLSTAPYQVAFGVSFGTININTGIAGGVTAGQVAGNGTANVVISASRAAINITISNANGVRYTPNANFNGTDTLSMVSNDIGATGIPGSSNGINFYPITVNSINDAPAGVNNTIFGLEETTYVFTTANFPFTDANDSPANGLQSVIITTLPGQGQLRLNNVAFAAGTEISAADIAAGNLTYVPNGSFDSSFTFQVRDNGGTALGGVNLDASANTLTLNIASNNAPFVDLNDGFPGQNFVNTWFEGGGPVPITFFATVTDANAALGDQIVSMFIEVEDFEPGDELLVIGALPAGISSSTSIVAGDLRLTLSGAASPADYAAALNQVRYNSANDNPNPPVSRTITVVANDGDDNSTTRTTTMFIVEEDDTAIANNDAFETPESVVLEGNLFASNDGAPDVNPDGPLVVAAINGDDAVVGQQITLPSGALLTVNADGTFSYDPNGSFLTFTSAATGASNTGAVDSFFYTLEGGSTAQVTIVVGGERSVEDLLIGTAGNDTITDAVDFNDSFFLQQGGNDTANGAGGNDGFFFGSALNGLDNVDGGAGNDTVAIQGFYNAPGNLVLGPGVVNVENLLMLSGTDTRFGDSGVNTYDYNVATNNANVAAGALLNVLAADLGPLEDLVFNGSAETDGAFRIFAGRGVDNLTGGAGGDGFLFGQQGNFTGADRVNGGAGTDSLALRGNYAGPTAVLFQDATMTNVEVVVLLSGLTNVFGGIIDPLGFDYDLTFANGNVAAGQQLNINATLLASIESVRIDARAELDGSVIIFSGAGDDILLGSQGADTINGGAGADQLLGAGGADLLIGGTGNDKYLYMLTSDSTAAARDTIRGFAAGDKIDLAMIDANGGAAGDGAFSFIGTGAFTNVAGQLRYSVSGANAIIEGDVNGDGIADLSILVENWVPVVGDFNL